MSGKDRKSAQGGVCVSVTPSGLRAEAGRARRVRPVGGWMQRETACQPAMDVDERKLFGSGERGDKATVAAGWE